MYIKTRKWKLSPNWIHSIYTHIYMLLKHQTWPVPERKWAQPPRERGKLHWSRSISPSSPHNWSRSPLSPRFCSKVWVCQAPYPSQLAYLPIWHQNSPLRSSKHWYWNHSKYTLFCKAQTEQDPCFLYMQRCIYSTTKTGRWSDINVSNDLDE